MGMKANSGFFYGTTGSSKNDTPVKKLGDVRYDANKTTKYLLNESHPVGGAKAKFFKDVLGYNSSDSKAFHKNVVSSILDKTPIKSENTKFGLKQTFKTKLIGKNNKEVTANVVVVIQKDNKRTTYKIVTVYPDKKEK